MQALRQTAFTIMDSGEGNEKMIGSYAFVLATVLLTVFGQIVIKWQVMKVGSIPETADLKFHFLLQLLFNPWIISALAAAFLASITWMAAMTKLPLSHGYPLTSLSFVLILLLAHFFFGEAITPLKVAGMVFIMLGIALVGIGNA